MRHLALFAILGVLAACGPRYAELPLTPTQLMSQSEDALRRGEYATAAAGFSEYLASGQQTFRARAFYELAQAQYGQENYEGALGTLADLESEYGGEAWAQPGTLRGDTYYALGKRVDAIEAWQAAWTKGSEGDRVFLRARIEEVSGELTPAERDVLADQLTDSDVRAVLNLGAPNELGAAPAPLPDAIGAGTTAEAPAPPAGAIATGAQPEADSLAREQALAGEQIPPDDLAAGDALAAGTQVACLLPLTGPDRDAGQRALAALRLAFAGDTSALLVRDTGGEPDLAARLATALAAEPTVIALIGPQREADAAAVAPLAERLQLPTVLLGTEPGLAGPYVVQADATQAPSDFAARFRGQHGRDPGTIEADAYAAGAMVREAIAAGARSRGAILDALRKGTRAAGS